jgi:acetyl esterase/lipase
MTKRRGVFLALIALVGLILVGGAVLLHLPAFDSHMAALHGAAAGMHSDGPAASLVGDAGGDPAVNARARDGVAAIGRRWDEAAFAQTVALYTDVHRGIEWPGVLAPETFRYGPDPRQALDLYRPEQEFSEPGPVFLFVHGNGLGNSDREAAGSDGLIYSHLGKLAATAGGIGVVVDYRSAESSNSGAMLESGAEDIRLAVAWIIDNIAEYDGDPGTIVIAANSEGATATAGYLFNEDWQMESGHGVAAAVLSSGLFGPFVPELERLVMDYAGQPVPIALWSAEYDTAQVSDGVADLHKMLCRKYDGCPWYEQIAGHNHVSQMMSLGTADTDVMNRFIRFYHTVR